MFSIEQSQPEPQLTQILSCSTKQDEEILYMNGSIDETKLISVCYNKNNNLITIRQSSIHGSLQIAVELTQMGILDAHICFAAIQAGDGFVVVARPFTVFFLSAMGQALVKLTLSAQVSYQTCTFDLSYPNLLIFGKQEGQSKPQVVELNLETLTFKVINDGKGYSPGIRNQELSILTDNRVYTFGGQTKDNVACPQLLYTFDIEKGYWFALEMKYPDHVNFSECEAVAISRSRVLIMDCKNGDKAWILEIHQSRLSELQNFESQEINGKLIILNGHLVWYNKQKWGFWNKCIVSVKKGMN